MSTIEKRISHSGKVSYRAKVRRKGHPPESKTFSKFADAQQWSRRLETEIIDQTHFPQRKASKTTVKELLAVYQAYLAATNPRRAADVRTHLKWWEGEFGHLTLRQLTSEHVALGQTKLLSKKWKNMEGQGTLSPSTVNRYIVSFGSAVQYAVKPLKWLQDNPVRDVKKLIEPPGRTRFLTTDEIDRLLEQARISKNERLFALVVFGISTGGRRAEIENLRWVDFNEDLTMAKVGIAKNGDARFLRITGLAHEIVQAWFEARPERTAFLFASPTDKTRPRDFESAWRAAVQRAGIEDFHFHDLRHTCASYMAMDGASLSVLAEVLGHKTLQMVKRYAHIGNSHAHGAVASMTGKVFSHVKL